MRRPTTWVLAILMLAILTAATVQIVFLADQPPAPLQSPQASQSP